MSTPSALTHFEIFFQKDVSKHVEKKANLSYLSWAWAVAELLKIDPLATWEYREPVKWGETVMVFCTVTAFGKAMTMQLPVMDNRNKAISNPDAFAVNTSMMRCLAKAIALHGLGLYIYAGEDLPEAPEEAPRGLPDSARSDYQVAIGEAASTEKLNALKASIRTSCEAHGDSHVYKFLLEKMAERAATLKGE